MKTNTKNGSALNALFVDELKDILDAEKQLVKALPKMAKAATSESLEAAITEHLAQTKGQVNRLEQVFRSLDMTARGKHCVAMEGLIEEGNEVIEDDLEDMVRDAALIGAAQKVEHYEIASYGTLIAHARLLGHTRQFACLSKLWRKRSRRTRTSLNSPNRKSMSTLKTKTLDDALVAAGPGRLRK